MAKIQKYVLSDKQPILLISWNCSDKESAIVKFRFAVRESVSHGFILPFHSLKGKQNSSGSAIVSGNGRWQPKYREGKTYQVGLELTNAVRLKSVYWTKGVLVDSTPPEFKKLRIKFNPRSDVLTASWVVGDEQSGVMLLQWGLGSSPEKNRYRELDEY